MEEKKKELESWRLCMQIHRVAVEDSRRLGDIQKFYECISDLSESIDHFLKTQQSYNAMLEFKKKGWVT